MTGCWLDRDSYPTFSRKNRTSCTIRSIYSLLWFISSSWRNFLPRCISLTINAVVVYRSLIMMNFFKYFFSFLFSEKTKSDSWQNNSDIRNLREIIRHPLFPHIRDMCAGLLRVLLCLYVLSVCVCVHVCVLKDSCFRKMRLDSIYHSYLFLNYIL